MIYINGDSYISISQAIEDSIMNSYYYNDIVSIESSIQLEEYKKQLSDIAEGSREVIDFSEYYGETQYWGYVSQIDDKETWKIHLRYKNKEY